MSKLIDDAILGIAIGTFIWITGFGLIEMHIITESRESVVPASDRIVIDSEATRGSLSLDSLSEEDYALYRAVDNAFEEMDYRNGGYVRGATLEEFVELVRVLSGDKIADQIRAGDLIAYSRLQNSIQDAWWVYVGTFYWSPSSEVHQWDGMDYDEFIIADLRPKDLYPRE